MLVGVCLLYAMALMRLAPDAAIVRALRRGLVELPAARLSGLTRRHLIFAVLLVLVVAFGSELLAAAGPFDAGLVVLWDIAAWFDVVTAIAVVTGAARLAPVVRVAASRLRGRPRSRRPRPARHAATLSNDDDGPSAVLAA